MTMRRCPALKMLKPVAMLCGYGTGNMAFFHMPDNVCREDISPQVSPTSLVTISGGSITSTIVEEVLLRVTRFTIYIKSHNVALEFKAWKSEEITHRFKLTPIWVHVHGVPHVLRHFLGHWVVGSVIGATLDVDLLCLRRRGIVRIQVAMLKLNAFKRSTIDSLSSDLVVQKKGYEFRYNLEKSVFRVDADFVPRVWKHGDDPDSDKGRDREDTMRANDPTKTSKASSSSKAQLGITLNIPLVECKFVRSVWAIVQIASNLYPRRSARNMFGIWLRGIEKQFSAHILVGAAALCWALWLTSNDIVFNNKCVSSPLQVIHVCSQWLRTWSILQRPEDRDLFMMASTRLERMVR